MPFHRFIRAFRLAFIVLFTLVDVGTILYNVRGQTYFLMINCTILSLEEASANIISSLPYKCYSLFQVINDGQSTTSYAGHAFGGLAGVLVGTILLENRKVNSMSHPLIDFDLDFKREQIRP